MSDKIRLYGDELIKNLRSYSWFILFVLIYLLYFYIFHHDEPNCLVKHTLGIPCATCGMTRGLLSIARFDFKAAFTYHPLSFTMPFIGGVFLFKGLPRVNKFYRSRWFWGGVISLFLIVYIIRMVLYYPNVVPMDHYHGSILDNLLH